MNNSKYFLFIFFFYILNINVQTKSLETIKDVQSDQPIGFASLGGSTTGGAGGDSVVVTSAQQLADIMHEREKGITTPLTVFIQGVLSDYSDKISIKRTANISLLGIGSDATFLGFGIKIWECSNIVVRNILFADCKVDEKDALSIDECSNVWVDHCSFTDSPSTDPSGDNHDGLLDIKNGSYNVTVSYNHFMNHRKTCLLGHTEDQVSDTTFKITYYCNWFEGTYSRHPRVRYARAHILNNLFTRINGYGVGVTCSAQVFLEANYFEDVPTPVLISKVNDTQGTLSNDPAGYLKAIDNYLTNSGEIVENLSAYNFNPSDYYNYTVLNVELVKEKIQTNSGSGKLNITTSIEQDKLEAPYLFTLDQSYPNPFNSTTKIKYALPESGFVTIKVFNQLGQEVAELVNEQQRAGEYVTEFNASKLASGIYFYRIESGSLSLTKKMILLK